MSIWIQRCGRLLVGLGLVAALALSAAPARAQQPRSRPANRPGVHLPSRGDAAAPRRPGVFLGLAADSLERRLDTRPGSGVPARSLAGTADRAGTASEAEVVLVVESFAGTAGAALAANSLTVQRVARAVGGFGTGVNHVEVGPVMAEPEHARPGRLTRLRERPRLLGFHAFQTVTVRTPRSDRVGLLIDLATGAGATGVLEVRNGPGAALR